MNLNTIHHGPALDVLKTLEPESIDLVVTSPPYFNLRNYGVEGQLGSEKTPKEYVSNLIQVFGECKRILKKTGSIWVNIGDTYSGSGGAGGDYNVGGLKEGQPRYRQAKQATQPKSLIGIPERLAIAMTDDLSLIRRNTIIWHKPNCMPSSARDRFTVDFEYFYFFSKSQKYFFETQYEPFFTSDVNSPSYRKNGKSDSRVKDKFGVGCPAFGKNGFWKPTGLGRIKRCVWNITTQPFKEVHFAVFPEALVETPIRSCCPPNGIVLDPFIGSGTVAVVAKKQGKNYVGVELNREYIRMAEWRLSGLLEDYCPPTISEEVC